MRGGRVLGVMGLIVAVLTLLTLPATALGAPSAHQIYADFSSHGKLVGHYSKAELTAALHDALVQGYGTPARAGLAPTVRRQLNAGVAPAQTAGALPFTGIDLGLIAAGGCVLLALGGALRALGRRG